MGSITGRRVVVAVLLALAIAGASIGAVVFSGGGTADERVSSGRSASERTGNDRSSTTTAPPSSTTTSSTTTTTTTAPPPPPDTAPPAPPAGPAAAPAPASAPVEEPPPPPPPEPVSFCSGGAGGTAGAVLAAMNAVRGGGLCWNSQLGGSAQAWAETMAARNSLFHSNIGALLGSTPFSTVGENVLSGPVGLSADAMVSAWMGSPDHRANILGPFSAAGVGIAQGSDGQWYVAVQFGG